MTKNSIDPVLAQQLARKAKAAREAKTVFEERDELIRYAIEQGNGLREVARVAGMAHTSVLSIIRKGNRKP